MVKLETKHGTLKLNNPVITASGTCGFGREMSEWFDLNVLGGMSVKGTTLMQRDGNPSPRIAECPDGLINSVGLQNPGVEKVVAEELPWLRKHYQGCILANVSGFSIDEYRECVSRIGRDVADAIELNISCPNVHGGGMAFGTQPEAAAEVTRNVREVTELPLFVKLSPNVTDITAIAKACVEAGADGLCLINTVQAMRIDTMRRKPVVANVVGGLSGPAVFPIAVRMVWQVASAVDVPIIGCGGVSSANDVIELMMAGASAVEVGSATLKDPLACKKIVEALPAQMKKLGINELEEIIGICCQTKM